MQPSKRLTKRESRLSGVKSYTESRCPVNGNVTISLQENTFRNICKKKRIRRAVSIHGSDANLSYGMVTCCIECPIREQVDKDVELALKYLVDNYRITII